MKNNKSGGVACQKKKEENQKECLPEDIIFEIFIRLSAEILHNYGRNVCQEWADLISNPIFIESHQFRSHKGLLIQNTHDHELKFLDVNKGKTVLKQETWDFPWSVFSCCRGIILFCLSEEKFSFCIANIVTKQIMELPCAPLDYGDPIVAAIGYDFLNEKFKVICFYSAEDESYSWLFLTVGKDETWRKADLVSSQIPFESFDGRMWVPAGGVIYGVYRRSNITAVHWGSNVIAVDLGDESTWTVNIPNNKEEMPGGFLEEKNKLTYISHGRKETTLSIYRLDDLRRSTWVKIYNFRLHPNDFSVIEKSSSLGSADNGEFLLFHHHSSSLVIKGCNLRTGSCKVLGRLSGTVYYFSTSKSLVCF